MRGSFVRAVGLNFVACAPGLLALTFGNIGTHEVAKEAAPVAAVIPVYEPDFHFLIDFMKQWATCPEGRAAMDVYVVFSSEESKDAFASTAGKAGLGEEGQKLWTPLVQSTDAEKPARRKKSSWKKLDGLAQILSAGYAHKFVMIMDVELAVNSCTGFSQLEQNLQEKFDAKVYYAARQGFFSGRIYSAVCSVVDCTQAGTTSKLRNATKDLTYFSWWNDVPWVEVESGKRMFGNWAEHLRKRTHALARRVSRSIEKLDYVDILHAAVQHDVIKHHHDDTEYDEVAVSGHLGTGPGKGPLSIAGYAFEHLIYQFYMVEHEGFIFHDLADDGLGTWCERCSMLECFHYPGHTEQDRTTYMRVVKPLWMPRHARGPVKSPQYAPPNGSSLLIFHLDRNDFHCRALQSNR